MRQRLPAGIERHLVRRQQAGQQCGHEILGLPAGAGDGEDEPARRAASAAMANGCIAAGPLIERPAAPSAASAEEIARSSMVAANSPDNGILADSTRLLSHSTIAPGPARKGGQFHGTRDLADGRR